MNVIDRATKKNMLCVIGTDGAGFREVYQKIPRGIQPVLGWAPDGGHFLASILESDGSNTLVNISVADGSALTPAIDAVGRVALAWLGVRRRLLGGILGGPAARANLRRAQLGLDATWAMMAAREGGPKAKYDPWHSKPWELGDPRRWVEAQFDARRTGFLGSGKYDWESIGRRILGALDDIRIAVATPYNR